MCLLGYYELTLLLLYRRDRRREKETDHILAAPPPSRALPKTPADWPRVLVQVATFNERYTIEEVIDAVCALQYPRERLAIQILDDSTDDTLEIAQKRVALHADRGEPIRLVHRTNREGYKAGALAAGLRQDESNAELIALFDSDFRPRPDFLRRLIIDREGFANPLTGFVQARWTYLNRDESFLTRIQAILLDLHFLIKKPTEQAHGLFMQFNGAGGIWRRKCIEDSGGWQSDTLTEDLDLSYRATNRGWRGIYFPDEGCDNQIPPTLSAFRRQQKRWARGTAQCLRKLPRVIWSSPKPFAAKVAATLTISGYCIHLASLLYMLVWPWLLIVVGVTPALIITQILMSPIWFIAPILFFSVARLQGGSIREVIPLTIGSFMLGVSLISNNTVALLRGLFGRESGEFERTPKGPTGPRDSGRGSVYRLPRDPTLLLDAALCGYFLISFFAVLIWGPWLWSFGLLVWCVPFVFSFHSLWIERRAAQISASAVKLDAPATAETN